MVLERTVYNSFYINLKNCYYYSSVTKGGQDIIQLEEWRVNCTRLNKSVDNARLNVRNLKKPSKDPAKIKKQKDEFEVTIFIIFILKQDNYFALSKCFNFVVEVLVDWVEPCETIVDRLSCLETRRIQIQIICYRSLLYKNCPFFIMCRLYFITSSVVLTSSHFPGTYP